MKAANREISAALRTSWIRKLYRWWNIYNEEYLACSLRQPLIELSSATQKLGQWDYGQRRISISCAHIEGDPWALVLDTLRHEMAHQYVSDDLDPGGVQPPHGEAFREACAKLRCSPSAQAESRTPHAANEEDRLLRLLKKILSLAASPNEHEAQAAVNKARRLMLEYNVDVVELDRERSFSSRSMGAVKGRHAAWELWLAMVLNGFFFVEVLWVPSYDALKDREGTTLNVYGTETNLEMAEYVYGYVTALLEKLWRDYKAGSELTGNRERMRYYAGVVQGFHAKLERELEGAAAQTALVWKGDSRLRDYYTHLNPHIVTRRTGGVSASAAYIDGISEGKRLIIHRPVTSSGNGFGGYLPSG